MSLGRQSSKHSRLYREYKSRERAVLKLGTCSSLGGAGTFAGFFFGSFVSLDDRDVDLSCNWDGGLDLDEITALDF